MKTNVSDPPLELSASQAAFLVDVELATLQKWIAMRLLVLKRGPTGKGKPRIVQKTGLLAILLLKLLRSRGAPMEAIRPASMFLSAMTRDQLEKQINAGNTVLFTAGGRVGFAPVDGVICNDTGEATMPLTVDLTALLRRAWYAIEVHNRKTEHQRN